MAKQQRGKLASFAATKTAAPAEAPPASRPAAGPAGARRGMTLRLDPATWRRLKLAAIDQGRPAHEIVVEALLAALDRDAPARGA
jgi:hypothetical protein